MNRLTKRTKNGQVYTPYCDNAGCDENCTYCDYEDKILEKLAEYEDAEEHGLLLRLPAPLDGTEMIELENNGKWLRIPCFIGDTVYEIVGEKWVGIRDWKYPSFKDAYVKKIAFTLEKYHSFGKTVFLTKEEAEQELAKLKEV